MPFLSFAQKYNFTNFGVEEGLVQSQANDVVQDRYGSLWIATLGGISRYDGNSFYNYTEADGLRSNLIYKILQAHNGTIWAGTEDGAQSFNGNTFNAYSLPKQLKSRAILNICEGKDNKIFLLSSKGEIVSVANSRMLVTAPLPNAFSTTIEADKNGSVLAAVYKHGIYRAVNSTWQLLVDTKQVDENLIVKKLFFDNENNMWLLCDKGVYVYKQGVLSKVLLHDDIKADLISIIQDIKGFIWIGTSRGAYKLTDSAARPEHLGANAGLADITINNIINDREGNLWFATDGEGVFRLSNSPFFMLNKSSGLSGKMVMGMAFEGNDAWIGTTDGGLIKQQGENFRKISMPSAKPEAQKINAVFKDSKQQLWAGTLGGGLWKSNGGNNFSEVLTDNGKPVSYVIGIYEDDNKNIWVTTPFGLYHYDKGVMRKTGTLEDACFSVFNKSGDTLLIGTTAGVWQLLNGKELARIELPGVAVNSANCFVSWKDYILVGTDDKGILFWDDKRHTVLTCSQKNGLASNFIFSLHVDSGGVIYAGTGHGISKIALDEKARSFTVKNFSSANSIYGPECNLNAVVKNKDGNIWFGTTKGIIVYNPKDTEAVNESPLVFLNTVKLFSKNIPQNIGSDTVVAWNNIPANLVLPYTQNHLTFEFLGVYLTNPGSLRYKYKLEGNDTGYSELVSIPKVIYSNLAPGHYRFKAIAMAENGRQSSNIIDFPFVITTPFFQRTWFKILMVALLIGAGISIQYVRTKIKARRAEAIKQLRLEEQQKIQQRTSEDLHDDLGNKISRIAVLADVLDNKMNRDDEERRKLVKQIKENAQSLYLGTKDIIWSLTPGNDNLYDVLERCEVFGANLFEDTEIEFNMAGQDERFKQVKVPVTINRNMVMIVKEALNNILKHSMASHAVLHFRLDEDRSFSVFIADDGKGIDAAETRGGNGLANIEKRTERIGGSFKISRNYPQGTVITTSFKIPLNGG